MFMLYLDIKRPEESNAEVILSWNQLIFEILTTPIFLWEILKIL